MLLLRNKMADGDKNTTKDSVPTLNSVPAKNEKKSENSNQEKGAGDNEDSESLEEQPLDIGEHYLVRRSDGSWRKFQIMS